MAFKAVLLCASALLVQSVLSCCGGGSTGYRSISSNSGCGCSSYGSNIGYTSYGSSLGNYGSSLGNYGSSLGNYGNSISSSPALSSGGDFPVISVGPVVPNGIAVTSDLALNGDLQVCGTLPWLSAVAFETTLPTSGSGSVDYSCGTGCVGINSVSGSSGTGSLSSLGARGCGCRI